MELLFQKTSVIANQLKENGVQLYDLGEITKYQLSIYQNQTDTEKKSMCEIINFILKSVPNSKIIMIGGADDACKGVHEAECIEDIIHIESQIDAKERFKL